MAAISVGIQLYAFAFRATFHAKRVFGAYAPNCNFIITFRYCYL